MRARARSPSPQLGGALRARLATTFPLSRDEADEIRRSVREYAGELKDLGLPPERDANDAGIRACASILSSRRCIEARTSLFVEIVGWCIAGYYGTPDRDS